MEPISNRERELIVIHKQNNKKGKEIAEWLMICEQTVSRVWQLFLKTGKVDPKPKNSGRKPLISVKTMDKIFTEINEQPDI